MLCLIVKSPASPPVAYRFDASRVTVGRSAKNGLCLLDRSVSRLHVEFRQVADSWCVFAHSSRNGTLHNGQPIEGLTRLSPGDEVCLGQTVLVFEDDVRGALSEDEPGETEPAKGSGRGTGELAPSTAIVGTSPAMAELRRRIEQVGPAESTVLITGETGTGKELVAAQIHARSPRSRRPFVAVNCAALPQNLVEAELFGIERGVATGVEARAGRFERARGGTLLLDEIGEMDLAAQSKLLRVLEEKRLERIGSAVSKPLDVRIVAATNRDLEAAVRDGHFRRDLYYRLRVIRFHLTPLRERPQDILPLTVHFLRQLGRPDPVPPAVLDRLLRQSFPGNVRELENLLEQACLAAGGGPLEVKHLDLEDETASPASVSEATGSLPMQGPASPAMLFDRVVSGDVSFWTDIAHPFLRRQIPPDEVRALIRAGYDATGSYRKLARLFRIESDYKKLLNFIQYHELGVRP